MDDKLRRVGLTGRVGPVYTAEELGVAKPDTAAYRAACRRFGLPPADVLHVGDRYDLDVEAARNAGLRAVHLDRGNTGPLGPAPRIASLSELPDLLARWVTRPRPAGWARLGPPDASDVQPGVLESRSRSHLGITASRSPNLRVRCGEQLNTSSRGAEGTAR